MTWTKGSETAGPIATESALGQYLMRRRRRSSSKAGAIEDALALPPAPSCHGMAQAPTTDE